MYQHQDTKGSPRYAGTIIFRVPTPHGDGGEEDFVDPPAKPSTNSLAVIDDMDDH